MMRASGNSCRILPMASTPLITDMRRSIKVMSGRCSRYSSTACCPFTPCALTSISATVLMSETNPCLTTAWSSITMMRSLLLIQRHLDNDLCTAFLRALDRQHATHLRGTLAHANQTEMTVSDLFAEIKSVPVVTNAEPHVTPVEV